MTVNRCFQVRASGLGVSDSGTRLFYELFSYSFPAARLGTCRNWGGGSSDILTDAKIVLGALQ